MISFIVGAVLGSFWCVVAERLPLRMNFWSDRSRCSTCQRPLVFYDLIPIISFIALQGNCRHCHQAIPRHIFVAEWIYGLFFCYLFSFSTATLETKLVALVWFTMAFSLSITDWLYQIIDPFLLYPFAIILWTVLLWQRATFSWWTWLLFFCIYWYGQRHWHFIGDGDLLLFFIWFPWLRWQQIHLLLFLASGTGILYYLLFLFSKRQPPKHLPFVPFLSIGLSACLFF
ncbi:prepilin peptidase [Enterococcus italicus]|uniref:prepilin peptidase n=1 Tax=Enterococcus italicus TaxID=246144 RepID=UPI0028B261B5|nr:prepilin peptidase [Enterococcus italicus]